MLALEAALGSPWAMTEEALAQLLSIAAREHEVTREALEKYRLDNVARAEGLQQRNNVGVLSIIGPTFRRANLFTEMSGATSYDMLRRDLQVAQDNRDITAILLNVDSPGGHANGVGELAKAIRESSKPVTAYVGGSAASAAYWLASAASEIVVDDSADLGSIGVIVGLKDSSAAEASKGVRQFKFVSSQSPLKHADAASEEGASSYQRLADDMADVFIAAVAEHRGVTAQQVAQDFGRGGVLVGAHAVAAGMADKIGTFEETLARLSGKEYPSAIARPRPLRVAAQGTTVATAPDRAAPAASTSRQENPMADETTAGTTAADLDKAKSEAAQAAVKADRERFTTIMGLPEAKGRETLAQHLHMTTDMTAAQVQGVLAVAPLAQAPAAPQAPGTPAPTTAQDAAAYDQSRLTGAGLTGGGTTATPQRRSLADGMRKLVDAQQKGAH